LVRGHPGLPYPTFRSTKICIKAISKAPPSAHYAYVKVRYVSARHTTFLCRRFSGQVSVKKRSNIRGKSCLMSCFMVNEVYLCSSLLRDLVINQGDKESYLLAKIGEIVSNFPKN
jgi:hypothetical protein